MTFLAAAAIAAGGTVIGGLLSSHAAGSAASTQAGAADRATQAQTDAFNKQIQLQEPFRQAGGLGLNSLLYGLGVSPTGTFTPGPAGGGGTPGSLSTAQLVDMSSGVPSPNAALYASNPDYRAAWDQTLQGHQAKYGGGYTRDSTGSVIEQMIRESLAPQMQAEAQGPQAIQHGGVTPGATPGPTDPAYGALTRSFTSADFQADPGYAFRLSEGEKALQRAKAASGSLGSGGYLKDLTDYSQGMASQEYGNAYNRYRLDQGTKLNALQSLSGVGQSATNTLTGAAGTLGQQVGSNIIGAGNATAAGQIGSANAINGAIGQGVSMYQQNQLLSRFPTYGTAGYGFSPNGGPAGVPANPFYDFGGV